MTMMMMAVATGNGSVEQGEKRKRFVVAFESRSETLRRASSLSFLRRTGERTGSKAGNTLWLQDYICCLQVRSQHSFGLWVHMHLQGFNISYCQGGRLFLDMPELLWSTNAIPKNKCNVWRTNINNVWNSNKKMFHLDIGQIFRRWTFWNDLWICEKKNVRFWIYKYSQI